jgi:hypothetical protein
MARIEIPHIVITSAGAPAVGALATVNIRNGGPASIFVNESTADLTAASNPLTTDSMGRIEGWVNEGSYDIVVSGAGITTYTQRFEANRGDGTTLIGTGAVAAGTFKVVGNVGFYNVTPIAQNTGWGATISPPAIGTGKTQLTAASTLNDTIRYVAELAAALKAYGFLGT